jgi:hypothetical protein
MPSVLSGKPRFTWMKTVSDEYREANSGMTYTKRRIHEASDTLLLVDLLQRLDF